MFKFGWKRLAVAGGLSLSLIVAGCGSDDSGETEDKASDNGGDTNYSEELDYAITGIEPGAGVFKASERAVEEYENLEGWEVKASSSGAMATALGEAINNEEPIIVTGWTPHWKFAKYDMHYLDDPKEVYGGEETINTMVRKGLKDDVPGAYKVLDQFSWKTEDMEKVMLDITDGAEPEKAAADWVKENEDMVSEWTDGAEEGDGEEIELTMVDWDSTVASSNVVKKVLEDLGYKVTLTPIDNAIMWKSVAEGDADGFLAGWLPVTHGDLYEEYKDDLEDLGPSLEGAKIGLAVPDYMDIESIEDLEPAK
ncbi:glycine betaine ABC transporter substrate-binding protein [Virgibacillus alimentarius]|uniref:Glycine betaine/proline transport system substrate-binding protein n=1 Tax=Virgibacillus alimentarius TaxID=698769 RepID=A0ABS4SBG3_9BACI|nr:MULTISPECIES: glycine betaine ABC transporter substrate-binding protein [Virgibacillus]MBP2258836.1 glycine betaine/proline transport system substrate-binding protein [Virgibacillus alimentarius]HLR65765.1 glycine betaine ABC transporter substrate-binding protein [Virgibacillus sp.]